MLVGATAFITTHLTRNEIPYLLQPIGPSVPFSLKRVLGEVLLALRNRDFLVLFMTLLTASAIGGTTEALNIYVQTYFWELNGEALRWFALAILGFMAAFAVIPIVQARFDKKRLVIYGLAFLVLNGVAMIGLRFLDVLPANGSPLLLPLLITNEIIRIGVFTVVVIMFGSMVADALDAQELDHGPAPGRRIFRGAVVLHQGDLGPRRAAGRTAARLRHQLSARRVARVGRPCHRANARRDRRHRIAATVPVPVLADFALPHHPRNAR